MTLGHVGREYPNHLSHALEGPEDARTPSELHPIFYGSFDWHSCVHGWWQLLRLIRLYPDLPIAAEVRARADAMLVPDKVAAEIAYFERPSAGGFERPYGWAWLLALHDEASRHDAGWAQALEPFALFLAERFRTFLPRLTYPLRVGTHFNTSFALTLAWDWAEGRDNGLRSLIAQSVITWFDRDIDCQAWEPGGDEFLSPALTEALVMSRVFDAPSFRNWFDAFLPRVGEGEPATLFTPAIVSDRNDGKIAHLDGLNLSRAWCWRTIAGKLGADHPVAARAEAAAADHLAASLPHIGDNYMGEHWLATFALLALAA
ncbi:hypothetical protein SUS17_2729 [Sphingomonas sp. S17]|jgi:hypothetical protein|uniref:DUF2891 domain-containing protein n=3 Tax=Sphingomonadaceae TaxID=41297 RepID=A0A411LNT2_SPHPI|nr:MULTISPECIES: DUF2891 domain-containing protein [Sphingomonas]EGI54451.1 hypothetical protein SUS17_2729 [Sphingomonas sp. S17]MBQ1479373.1 DUF2891 domain-containing protein [Sphingomonas sp.]MCM3677944.1 DUF2891 domain-containing protein [Sphingomonas paucimobilis]MDG5972573.1 hypothetical protein [Sphingomonas paucimobilis]NNG59005.1 DUF2891 domain-containing protein [Sphingomonas paucimobilis]